MKVIEAQIDFFRKAGEDLLCPLGRVPGEKMERVLRADGLLDAEEVVILRKCDFDEIVTACVALDDEGIGDHVYVLREREAKGWYGPRVTAWGRASDVIHRVAKAFRRPGQQCLPK